MTPRYRPGTPLDFRQIKTLLHIRYSPEIRLCAYVGCIYWPEPGQAHCRSHRVDTDCDF